MNRTTTFTVRVTPEELQAINAQVQASGLSKSEIARRAIFGLDVKTRKPVIDTVAMRELAAIGNNLNQIVKAMHQGRVAPDLGGTIDDMHRRITDLYVTARGGA